MHAAHKDRGCLGWGSTAPEARCADASDFDVGAVRTPVDFAAAFDRWIDAVGEVRPDVMERLVRELAKAETLAENRSGRRPGSPSA